MPADHYDLINISRARPGAPQPVVIQSQILNFQTGAGEVDLSNNAAPSRVYLATGQTLDVVSTSTADDGSPVGTGAHTVSITGLDDDYNEISETVILNGTSVVVTALTYLRVNKMRVVDVGTGLVNAGIITAEYTAANTDEATIIAGAGISKNSQFTVPAGKSLLMLETAINAAKNATGGASGLVDITQRARTENNGTSALGAFSEVASVRLDVLIQNFASLESDLTILIPEKSDLALRVATSTNGVDIKCRQSGILFTPN